MPFNKSSKYKYSYFLPCDKSFFDNFIKDFFDKVSKLSVGNNLFFKPSQGVLYSDDIDVELVYHIVLWHKTFIGFNTNIKSHVADV